MVFAGAVFFVSLTHHFLFLPQYILDDFYTALKRKRLVYHFLVGKLISRTVILIYYGADLIWGTVRLPFKNCSLRFHMFYCILVLTLYFHSFPSKS